MIRRLGSRIAVRLLLFNVLVVFLPVAGLFSLRSLELQLLDLQERSMVQQGRLVAAALSPSAPALAAEDAQRLILRLGGHSESRIRVVDRNGTAFADSANVPVRSPASAMKSPEQAARTTILYRIGAVLWQAVRAVRDRWRRSEGTGGAPSSSEATAGGIIRKALSGRYGATFRETPRQRSLTLDSALPIRDANGRITGAVVISQPTSRILRALWRIRLDIFRVFVVSMIVAMVLSLLFATTIARPLMRLRDEADELLDHRGRLRRTFGGSQRRDEIGDLTRALEKLTARLERHLLFVESFSADVSHEFKNPLASIRSAAELLVTTTEPSEKEQLGRTIDADVARLNRLLNGVREVSRIDSSLDNERTAEVDLRPILTELSVRWKPGDSAVTILASMPPDPVLVLASTDRLDQAFSNIVDNAISFSPPGGRVAVSLSTAGSRAIVLVEDEGPGIPPEHHERVFDRFFSFRPGAVDARRNHDGLGLAIARAIVEGHGGTIIASNRPAGGARIEVSLPLAKS